MRDRDLDIFGALLLALILLLIFPNAGIIIFFALITYLVLS